MKRITRREFLGRSAAGMGAVALASSLPADLLASGNPIAAKMPFGFQAWTLREALVKDFPGTLKKMSDMGYKTIEMCSPPGYQFAGFGPLMKYSAKEMKQIFDDNGLMCISSHYGVPELKNNLQERIDFALEVGQTQMVLSSFGLPGKATLDDWLKAADELNEIGRKSQEGGIQMGFHNHHMEFAMLEDKLIYDELMNRFDPKYIKMQFQVAVISIGYKAADYFRKYPDRFISAHLADYSEDKKNQVPVGKGIVDWKEFFAALETGGVRNIFVEMDPETFSESAEFLKKTV